MSQSLGQRIISRRPLSRFIQIDRLVNVITATGTHTTPPFYLPHARYIEASPTCAWRVQVVLNSMTSWEAPPRAWQPPGPPPDRITLRSGASPVFQIAETGDYAMDLVVEGFNGHHPLPDRICPFRLDLRAADGHPVHLAGGKSDRAEWPSWKFLGAGQWTVDMDTPCDWQLVVRPMIGPSGGGARWF